MVKKHRHLLKIKTGFRFYWVRDDVFRANYKKVKPHRPRNLERKYGKRVRVYTKKVKVEEIEIVKPEPEIEEAEQILWWRASVSAKTKDVFGRVTNIDGTATHYGTQEETVTLLKEGFHKSCGYPLWYWKKDTDGRWFLDFDALRVYVEYEKPDPKTERVSEEVSIISCR